MVRTKPTLVRLLIFLAAILLLSYYFSTQVEASEEHPIQFTVPTRTPTPGSSGGNDDGGDSNNDGGSSGSQSSQGSDPAPTSTPAPTEIPVTLAPTPIDGFISPTECGIPYYVAEFGETNVRAFPDPTTQVVGGLVYFESRPIVAKSAEAPWWKIILADGTQGWVFDEVGKVYGVLDNVPTLNSAGEIVSNPIWAPTPNPNCAGISVAPVATPETTIVPSDAAQSVESEATVPQVVENAEPSDTAESVVVPEQEETDQAVSIENSVSSDVDSEPGVDSEIETSEESVQNLQEDGSSSDSGQTVFGEDADDGASGEAVVVSGAEPDQTEVAAIQVESNDTSSSNVSATESTAIGSTPFPNFGSINWIIFIGLGLIIVGLLSMLFQRREPNL